MTAVAVIDAAFGDCGKGLMTDYHAHRLGGEKVTVVRFNGGAQAGHTVVDGKRQHVFSHVGSGTFAGAKTYLSRFFIANPLLLKVELADLRKIGAYPDITIDARAMVTTPWDMWLNTMAERARGDAKHGSVGVGINETVTRHDSFPLTARDLVNLERLAECVMAIETQWFPARADALGLRGDMREPDHMAMFHAFMEAVGEMKRFVEIDHDHERPQAEHLVFEGAQGLLLDEKHQYFPHVTRSRTGMPNVAALCDEWGIGEVEVTYVLRAYMTRHGAGPFPTHEPNLSYPDDTNVPNDPQGAMRFGILDIPLIAAAVGLDVKAGGSLIKTPPLLAMTHLDQVGQRVPIHTGRAFASSVYRSELAPTVARHLDICPGYASWGPRRDNVGLMTPWPAMGGRIG